MKIIPTILIITVYYVGVIENYRILGLFLYPGKSHMVMFEKIMQALANKGHEVDVVSHFPRKTSMLRYNDISVQDTRPIIKFNFTSLLHLYKNEEMVTKFIAQFAGTDHCDMFFKSDFGKQLRNTNMKYDAVITHTFGTDCLLGFGHHLQVPVVGVITSVSLPWTNDRMGNPDNPSYIPNYFASTWSPMTLIERILNSIVLVRTKLRHHIYSYAESNRLSHEFFGPDIPDLQDLVYNTSLILVNSHFSINQARPMVPNFIEVGGLHIEAPKPLPESLEKYLQLTDEYKGVIYFSTGSMIRSDNFPLVKLQAFLKTFKELPYKVLWKSDREQISKLLEIPPNVRFESWLPQLDVLCHPNVKLFITHGGLFSMQEAVYCGVPQLGIPFFADQDLNLKTSEGQGHAIVVEFDAITKDTILRASKTLLEEPSYKENAQIAFKLFRDRPISPLDTAIYWIEYVIRYKGAPHLRSVGASLPWYQYYLVDVIAVLLTGVVLFTVLCYYLLTLLIRSSLHKRSNKKLKTK